MEILNCEVYLATVWTSRRGGQALLIRWLEGINNTNHKDMNKIFERLVGGLGSVSTWSVSKTSTGLGTLMHLDCTSFSL